MNKLAIIFVLLTVILGLSCSNKGGNSQLKISAVPNTPFVVGQGRSTTIGGTNGFSLSPPYFTINSLVISWTGSSIANIIAIEVQIPDQNSGGTFNCSFAAGDDFKIIFPNEPVLGTLTLKPSATPSISSQFGCSSIPAPSPFPDSGVNIPATIKVFATLTDPNNPLNTTGRAQATTAINLH